jgi:hypothetical protein
MNDLRALGWVLRALLGLAFLAALGGAFLPGRAGTVSAVACVAVLVGAPVLRVGWLTVGWLRQGDRRFAALGGVLLVVLAASGAVALV